MDDSRMTDAELVLRCLEGEQRAHEALLARYRDRIFSFILRIVRNPEDAEDIAQSAFIKAFRALGAYDPERPFISWLFKISHNCCLDFLRARKPQSVSLDDESAPLELEDSSCSVAGEAGFHFQAEEAERLLACLPPLYREVLLLAYREDFGPAEIARALDIPEGTAKVRLFRARRAMAEKLSAMELCGKT